MFVHSDGIGKGCTFSLEIPLISAITRMQTMSGVSRHDSDPTDIWGMFDTNDQSSKTVNTVNTANNGGASSPGDRCQLNCNRISPILEFDVEMAAQTASADTLEFIPPSIKPKNNTNNNSSCVTESSKMCVENCSSSKIVIGGLSSSKIFPESNVTAITNCKYENNMLSGLRALIVDDSALNCKMICMFLRKLGVQCQEASDGARAVSVFSKFSQEASSSNASHGGGGGDSGKERGRGRGRVPVSNLFDFVVIDYNMPVMNGPQACSELRKLGYEGAIFGLTGETDSRVSAQFLEAGATKIFSKPLEMELFKRTLLTVFADQLCNVEDYVI